MAGLKIADVLVVEWLLLVSLIVVVVVAAMAVA
jgi:hypothetical protein